MEYEIITGTDDDIDGEILSWANAGDGWANCGIWEYHNVIDALDFCPSIDIDHYRDDCGMLSGCAYVITTDNPRKARQEIRDVLAEQIRDWRREQQAIQRKRANTQPRNCPDLPMEEVQAIALEVCKSQGQKSAIDGFNAWSSIEVALYRNTPKETWPDDMVSVASMTMDHHCLDLEDAVFYRRTKDSDELWARNEHGSRKAASIKRHGAQKRAVIRLLAVLLRAGAGWVIPKNMTGGQRVSTEALYVILNTVMGHLKEVEEKTRERGAGSRIVETAKELGLHPVPSMEGRRTWQARCPSRNHFIDIEAGSDYWFCGYCGEKGGPQELENLVAGRLRVG